MSGTALLVSAARCCQLCTAPSATRCTVTCSATACSAELPAPCRQRQDPAACGTNVSQRRLLQRHNGSSRHRHVTKAIAGEVAPEWTLDQIAGLGFGFLLLVTIYLALQVDVFVARAQRRELGLCEDCGGVNDPATCPQPQCPARSASWSSDED